MFGGWLRLGRKGSKQKMTQLGVYEESVVTYDGGFFRPLDEAVERWDQVHQDADDASGRHLEVLYELKDGRFVLVRYFNCRLVPDDSRSLGWELWFSSKPPEAVRVSEVEAVQFLLNAQHPIPHRLDDALRRLKGIHTPTLAGERLPPKDPTPLRPWSTWTAAKYFGRRIKDPAHEADVVEELRILINWIVTAVQALRDDKPLAHLSVQATIDFFLGFLFKRYPVDFLQWWGSDVVPPSEVDLLELRWPEKSFRAQEAIRTIRGLLDGPLTVKFVSLPAADPLFPTWAEQLAADEAINAAIPEVEKQLAIIKEVYSSLVAAREQSQKAAEATKERVESLKKPSKRAFQVWWLMQVPDVTQDWAAKKYKRLFKGNMDQGQVSRLAGEVDEWLKDGNVAPQPGQLDLPDIVTLDPTIIDLGEREDGHTPRQRQKRVDDGEG